MHFVGILTCLTHKAPIREHAQIAEEIRRQAQGLAQPCFLPGTCATRTKPQQVMARCQFWERFLSSLQQTVLDPMDTMGPEAAEQEGTQGHTAAAQ